ncbi:aminoglycoside phosphotransferase family protein [Nocardia sp. BMG111209]|uniref:aminoglycoside phosphotransferase family protein n=1 Tax=Nocardia sp. BMG111209 TaxID=1160137 RepID=UPI00036A0DA1|nr:aminoglycoside phosphotransferase family protein [Nocardia sp. BMG111209]
MRGELITWLLDVWPDHDWERATVRQGCFHDVAVTGSAVARVSRHGSQPQRLAREHAALTAVTAANLPVEHPRPLSEVVDRRDRSAMLVTVAPGAEGPQPDWDTVADELGALLRDLHGTAVGPMPAPRSWCGGARWPDIVTDSVIPELPAEGVTAAHRVVADILTAEAAVPACFVHGDFGPHNILWHGSKIRSLIDFDHSCVGDPAIDYASLISFYGAAAVGALSGDPALLDRALRHRAGFTLQLAAAAILVGDEKLFRHAIGNFGSRLRAGILHDPGGWTPRRW